MATTRPEPLLSAAEKRALERLAEDSARRPRETLRARIVLLAADGANDREVADRLGASLPTVTMWRSRYAEMGIEGLHDRPRPGRPRVLPSRQADEADATVEQAGPFAPSGEGLDAADASIEHLLQAACRTISARGFNATRVADIAAEAGVSPSTVHYHFKTREDILVRALLWANGRLGADLERGGEDGEPPLTQIARFLERTIPYPGTQEDEYRLEIDLWAQARHHPELLEPYAKYAQRWMDALAGIIRRGASEGVFELTASVEEVAERLIALTDGLAAQTVIGTPRMPPERVRELVLNFAAEQLGVEVTALDQAFRSAGLQG